MKSLICLLGYLVGSTLVGCATPADEDTELAGPASAEVIDDGKADSAELKVRAGNMTVWIDRVISVRRDASQTPYAVIRGRASRTLSGAFSFVPDDAFGEATLVGPRSFEIVLRGGHELNTMFSGLPLLLDLDAATSPSTSYTVKLDLRPAFAKFEGTSSIHVGSTLRPIFIGKDEPDPLRYVADVSTGAAPLTVENGGAATVVPANGGFDVLFAYGDLEAAWNTGAKVAFTAGGKTKRAALEARMTRIAMTTQDPYDTWPPARCDVDTYNCTLEHRGVDLQTCGDYRVVEHCAYADICEITDAAPLAVRPIDLGFAWQSQAAAYRAGCATGGTWCSLTEIDSFTLPECLAQEPSLEQVVA
nr:hypothetical protein [Deltaproteobacteria bacterium]